MGKLKQIFIDTPLEDIALQDVDFPLLDCSAIVDGDKQTVTWRLHESN